MTCWPRKPVETTGYTMYIQCIHVHTLYRHVHTLYMGTTYFMHVPLSYIPLQTRLYHLHDPTYNASVQESALLYFRLHTGMYSLRMALAGGQLSCSTFTFSCTDITVHGLTMYKRWHTRMYVFLKKCYRKADHLPQPFFGSTSLNPACTEGQIPALALYEPIMKVVQASTNAVPQEDTALMYVRVHTCSYHLYTMYIHDMYNITLPWTKNTKRKLIAMLQLRIHDHLHNSQLP